MECPMGTQADVEKIREIYRAEREAARIVRDAEEAARTLIAEAAAAAERAMEERRGECARLAGEARSKALEQIEEEARAFLDNARRRTEEWVRRSEKEIDAIASALVEKVLPP
jgi:vacuolar-type H+-ATPase subunit H